MEGAELVSFTAEFFFDLNKVLLKAFTKKSQDSVLVPLVPGGQL
jgi:hypothetical protein